MRNKKRGRSSCGTTLKREISLVIKQIQIVQEKVHFETVRPARYNFTPILSRAARNSFEFSSYINLFSGGWWNGRQHDKRRPFRRYVVKTLEFVAVYSLYFITFAVRKIDLWQEYALLRVRSHYVGIMFLTQTLRPIVGFYQTCRRNAFILLRKTSGLL